MIFDTKWKGYRISKMQILCVIKWNDFLNHFRFSPESNLAETEYPVTNHSYQKHMPKLFKIMQQIQ